MDIQAFLRDYWPLLLLGAWFGYKWWRARKVAGMLPELKQAGAVLIDVRSPAEFAQGNAPGTVNIPLQELGSRLHEIPKAYPVVVGCASGTRSGMAAMLLKRHGYAAVYNIGAWSNFLK
ncbi:MAG: rhodanese-like domain-containing protein [Burkholderiales bacterium]|nr:rhodanese-like domain-containing protein [Burkholderiales bacterium]